MNSIELIFELMDKTNTTAYALSKATGISNSNISDWKKGKGKPSADAVAKIADYFDVSTDYLLGRTDDPSPATSIEDNEEYNQLLEELRSNPDMRALLSVSKKATAEDLKMIINFVKALRNSNNYDD